MYAPSMHEILVLKTRWWLNAGGRKWQVLLYMKSETSVKRTLKGRPKSYFIGTGTLYPGYVNHDVLLHIEIKETFKY